MKKILYHATMATLLFCIVMNIVISVYVNTTGIDIEQHNWLHLLDIVVNFLYIVSGIAFGIFIGMTVLHYINLPEERMTIPHCKAEVEWTEIERDEEGEEISRKHYKVEFCHTMLDHQLDRVVYLWHKYRRKYDQDARSNQDFIDFVNGFTTFWAANTEEELVNRLKNK